MRKKIETYGLAVLMAFSLSGVVSSYSAEIPKEKSMVSSDSKVTSERKGNADHSNTLKDKKKVGENKEKDSDLKRKEEKLRPLQKVALSDEDFMVKGIDLGSDIRDFVEDGKDFSVLHGVVSEEWHREGLTLKVNDTLPYDYGKRTDLDIQNKLISDGIVEFYVEGPDISTKRGIVVGSPRESILRAYGIPNYVLWDGKNGIFRIVYRKDAKQLVFRVKENRVISYSVSYAAKPPVPLLKEPKSNQIEDRDFSIAGFSVGSTFSQHIWDIWEKKMTNPKEEIWYFSGYAVRERIAGHRTEGIFITDARMMTSRGLTLGDHVSTAEYLYGKPDKIEMETGEGAARAAYIYFSRKKDYILILYVQNEKIEGIVVTDNPEKKMNVR